MVIISCLGVFAKYSGDLHTIFTENIHESTAKSMPWLVPPRTGSRMVADLDRLFGNVQFIRCDRVWEMCRAFRKTINFVEIGAYVLLEFSRRTAPHTHRSPRKITPNHQNHGFASKSLLGGHDVTLCDWWNAKVQRLWVKGFMVVNYGYVLSREIIQLTEHSHRPQPCLGTEVRGGTSLRADFG